MDSLEDRIYVAGKHEQFSTAVQTFRAGKNTPGTQQELYDVLTDLGASPEEADEFVNMEASNHE